MRPRGGQQGAVKYHLFAGSDNIDQVAWHPGDSGGRRRRRRMRWACCSRNVWQMCWDWIWRLFAWRAE